VISNRRANSGVFGAYKVVVDYIEGREQYYKRGCLIDSVKGPEALV
jgi:hypothetical protein